jgi:SulP family sulfate permease
VLTVVFDLVVAIEVGMLIAVVLFMKRMADVARIRTWKENTEDSERLKDIPEGTEVVEFEGPMFFASSETFSSIAIKENTKTVIIRMRNVPALDVTAMRSLFDILATCKKSDVTLILSHTNEQPLSVMKKAGFYNEVGEHNFLPNIDEALAYAEKLNN